MGICRALVLALLLVVSGCAEADRKSSGPSPTTAQTSTTGSPEATAGSSFTTDLSPPTQRELNSAARSVMRAPSLDFTYDLLLGGKPFLELDGTWRRQPIGWASEAEMSDPEQGEDYVMRTTSIGKDLWMQMAQWPREQRKCWLAMEPRTVPLGINPLVPGQPGPIRMLGHVVAGADGNEVLLAGAIAMLPAKTIVLMGLERFQRDQSLTVPAYVLIAEGEITDIRVKGIDIAAALPDPPKRQQQVLEQIDIELSYDAGGTSYEVRRPAEGTITDVGGRIGCGA